MTTTSKIAKQQPQLTEHTRQQIGTVLEFKWTYGYNICTLRDRFGKLLGRCNGGGYDMKGTAFGQWIAKEFQPELKQLAQDRTAFAIHDEQGYRHPEVANPPSWRPSEKLYGGCAHYKGGKLDHVSLDGGSGFSSMRDILNAIGLDVRWLHETKKTDLYEVVERKQEVAS